MKVKFKRPFFIDGWRYLPDRIEDVLDRFRDRLPSDAEIVDEAATRKQGAPKVAAPQARQKEGQS